MRKRTPPPFKHPVPFGQATHVDRLGNFYDTSGVTDGTWWIWDTKEGEWCTTEAGRSDEWLIPLGKSLLKGASTNQIATAPRGAMYIIPSMSTEWYFKDLCFRLGRMDLTLRGPDTIRRQTFMGWRAPIVIDHAVDMSGMWEMQGYIDAHNSRFV